jgi:hypothetical protein
MFCVSLNGTRSGISNVLPCPISDRERDYPAHFLKKAIQVDVNCVTTQAVEENVFAVTIAEAETLSVAYSERLTLKRSRPWT